MKILEAQSALLSNYEVHEHLTEQRARYSVKGKKRRGPPNLENVVRELLQYFHTPPNPLSQTPIPYTPECITQLLERLRPFDLSKGEFLMILNMRPASVPALNITVEDMAERFSEEAQEQIIEIIGDVLGRFGPPDAENVSQPGHQGEEGPVGAS